MLSFEYFFSIFASKYKIIKHKLMKKLQLLIIAILFGISTTYAQRVLSPSEIRECRTAESVAWNFITSIVEKQWSTMEELMAPLYRYQFCQDMNNEGLCDYDQVFNSDYIHDITEMRPLLAIGYKLVITDVYTMVYGTQYSNDLPYKGWNAISVCFYCDRGNSPYENTQYDSDARIILVQIDGDWRVADFK